MATFDKITFKVRGELSVDYFGAVKNGKPAGRGAVVGFKDTFDGVTVRKFTGTFSDLTVTDAEVRFERMYNNVVESYVFKGKLVNFLMLDEGELVNETRKYTLNGKFGGDRQSASFISGTYTKGAGKLTGGTFNFKYYTPPAEVGGFNELLHYMANVDGEFTYEPDRCNEIMLTTGIMEKQNGNFNIVTLRVIRYSADIKPRYSNVIYRGNGFIIEAPTSNCTSKCNGEGFIYVDNGEKLTATFVDGQLASLKGNTAFEFARENVVVGYETKAIYKLKIGDTEIKLSADNY